jgi:hypothetical protein
LKCNDAVARWRFTFGARRRMAENGFLAPAGPFSMAGRFSGPQASLIDGAYKIPEGKRVP